MRKIKPVNAGLACTSLADNDGNDSGRVPLARLGYRYGAGTDLSFGYNRCRTYRTLLFIKVGVNGPFGQEVHKADDVANHRAGIRQGDWLITVGVTFAGNC